MKEMLIKFYKNKPAMFITAMGLLFISLAIIYFTTTGEGAYFTYFGRNSSTIAEKSQLMRHYCEINNISPSLCSLKHNLYCDSHLLGNIIFVIFLGCFYLALPKMITDKIKYYFADIPENIEGPKYVLILQLIKYVIILIVTTAISIYLVCLFSDRYKDIDIAITSICWFLIWLALSALPFISITIIVNKLSKKG